MNLFNILYNIKIESLYLSYPIRLTDKILQISDTWMYYNSEKKCLLPIKLIKCNKSNHLVFFATNENGSDILSDNYSKEQIGVNWGIATHDMQLIIPCKSKTISCIIPNLYMATYNILFIKPLFKARGRFEYYANNDLKLLNGYTIKKISTLGGLDFKVIGDLCIIKTKFMFNKNQIIIASDGKTCELGPSKRLVDYNENYMIITKEDLSREKETKPSSTYALYKYLQLDEPIIPHIYERLEFFNDKTLVAYKNKKFGYIDIEGNIIIPIELEESEKFDIDKKSLSNGMLSVSIFDGCYFKYGFMNIKGELVTPIIYDEYRGFYDDGTAKVLLGSNIITIDVNGNCISSESRFFWDYETRYDNW